MVWAILDADQNAALKELIRTQNSDRIVAVVGGAMIDNSLRHALESRFRPKSGKTDMNEKLFRPGGALGNLQPKIDLAYQLYMLDKLVRNTLHGIAEIRNLFAHHLTMRFSSDDSNMKKALTKLALHVGRTHYPSALWDGDTEHLLEPIHQTRDLFFVNLKLALIWLMADSHKHEPWSNMPTRIRPGPPERMPVSVPPP
jgi:hypothetical protein